MYRRFLSVIALALSAELQPPNFVHCRAALMAYILDQPYESFHNYIGVSDYVAWAKILLICFPELSPPLLEHEFSRQDGEVGTFGGLDAQERALS